MGSSSRQGLLLSLGLSSLLLLSAGCKQGLGERCQIDEDCSAGICSVSEHVCRETSSSGADATPVGEDDAAPPADAAPEVDGGGTAADAAASDAAAPDAAPADAAVADAS